MTPFCDSLHVLFSFSNSQSVVNHPSLDENFTRIVEYKHFLQQSSPHTVIFYEHSKAGGEPYYVSQLNLFFVKNLRIGSHLTSRISFWNLSLARSERPKQKIVPKVSINGRSYSKCIIRGPTGQLQVFQHGSSDSECAWNFWQGYNLVFNAKLVLVGGVDVAYSCTIISSYQHWVCLLTLSPVPYCVPIMWQRRYRT